MLSGAIEIQWGDHLEERLTVEPGDMLYVPPRQTHIVRNRSETEPAEYVVARDSPTEDSVEVPWAGDELSARAAELRAASCAGAGGTPAWIHRW